MSASEFKDSGTQTKNIQNIYQKYADANARSMNYEYAGKRRRVATFEDFVTFHGDIEKVNKHRKDDNKVEAVTPNGHLNQNFHKRDNYTEITLIQDNNGSVSLGKIMDSPEKEVKLSTSEFFIENRFLDAPEDKPNPDQIATLIQGKENSYIVDRHTKFLLFPKKI